MIKIHIPSVAGAVKHGARLLLVAALACVLLAPQASHTAGPPGDW